MTKYMLRKLKKEIKDPNTPESRLIELMNMDLGLAFAVAEFGNIPNKLIEELLEAPNNYLRDALSRNPNLSVRHLQHLCSDEFLPARYTALRRLLHRESKENLLEWFEKFIVTCPDALMVKQVKLYLIEDARTPVNVLQMLAQDPDETVRQYLEEKRKEQG